MRHGAFAGVRMATMLLAVSDDPSLTGMALALTCCAAISARILPNVADQRRLLS